MDSSMAKFKALQRILALAFLLAMPAAWAQSTGATPTLSAACPTLLNHTFARLQDEKPQSLCQYSGKVILVVNTASYCGFTSQYKGLESVYSKYKDKGWWFWAFRRMILRKKKAITKTLQIFARAPLA